MEDLLFEIAKQGNFIIIFARVLIVDASALGVVLLVGRGLQLIKYEAHTTKNLIAYFIMVIEFWYILSKHQHMVSWDLAFYTTINSTIAWAAYTLFFWRLYTRIDNLLARVIGKDSFTQPRKKNDTSPKKTTRLNNAKTKVRKN